MGAMTRERMVNFRVTEEEFVALERAARKEKMTMSEWLRKVIMVEHMMEWDHTAMRVVRQKIERDIRAALEEHLMTYTEEMEAKKKRA
jgi:hypothetical protein